MKTYKSMRSLFFVVFLFCLSAVFVNSAAEARIRMRRVKEEPRTCATMKMDPYLSRPDKKIYGTLRNSVVIENTVSIIGDLGNKICEWPLDKFNKSAPVDKFSFYIDEYKNILVPYARKKEGYAQLKINLSNCQVEEEYTLSEPRLPKCDPPAKKRKSSKSKKRA